MSFASKRPTPPPQHAPAVSPTGLKTRALGVAMPRPARLVPCSARGRGLRTRLFAKVTGIPL